MKPKVAVIDDSPFIRRLIIDWLEQSGEYEVVGSASNGEEGFDLVKEKNPDVVTLDVEMPRLDGLGCLRLIMEHCPTQVIMVSSLTATGTRATFKALDLGAIDFLQKPNGSSSIQFVSCRAELLEKLKAATLSRKPSRLIAKPATESEPTESNAKPAKRLAPSAPTDSPKEVPPAPRRAGLAKSDKVVVIASSTGGPKALAQLWKDLPVDFSAPILMVQHMPPGFTESFAQRLNSIGTVPCREAKNGDKPVPGLALMAPGGKHMEVSPKGEIILTDGPTIHGVKPAADLLFHSASRLWKNKVVGAILTGMGKDGAEGAVTIRKNGGFMVGESEDTCVVYGMPRAAKDAGGIDIERPLGKIADVIVETLNQKVNRAS